MEHDGSINNASGDSFSGAHAEKGAGGEPPSCVDGCKRLTDSAVIQSNETDDAAPRGISKRDVRVQDQTNSDAAGVVVANHTSVRSSTKTVISSSTAPLNFAMSSTSPDSVSEKSPSSSDQATEGEPETQSLNSTIHEPPPAGDYLKTLLAQAENKDEELDILIKYVADWPKKQLSKVMETKDLSQARFRWIAFFNLKEDDKMKEMQSATPQERFDARQRLHKYWHGVAMRWYDSLEKATALRKEQRQEHRIIDKENKRISIRKGRERVKAEHRKEEAMAQLSLLKEEEARYQKIIRDTLVDNKKNLGKSLRLLAAVVTEERERERRKYLRAIKREEAKADKKLEELMNDFWWAYKDHQEVFAEF
jgi:hypothetical protein